MSVDERYSVCQFFADGEYEYVLPRFVPAEQAVPMAISCSTNPAAKAGVVARVIIVDGGDSIAWEWKRGEGIVFPPEFAGRLK